MAKKKDVQPVEGVSAKSALLFEMITWRWAPVGFVMKFSPAFSRSH